MRTYLAHQLLTELGAAHTRLNLRTAPTQPLELLALGRTGSCGFSDSTQGVVAVRTEQSTVRTHPHAITKANNLHFLLVHFTKVLLYQPRTRIVFSIP